MMTPDTIWGIPRAWPELTREDVHVWRAVLDQPESVCRELEPTLAPDECARAARFHFETDRRRFVVGRGVLRQITASYLALAAHDIQFAYRPRGKPILADAVWQRELHFNVSHSRNLALFAFARQELGVDLEYVRPVPDAEQIAARFFSAAENSALQALPPEQRQEAFFAGWTRKEAYIKALGDGLSMPLDQFDVSLAPGRPAELLRIHGAASEARAWTVVDLSPEPCYRAALALRGQCRSLSCFHWDAAPQRQTSREVIP